MHMLAHLANIGARLFETEGYESVTMEQIAEEADVAKRTLYNHFPTKEALLAHWLEAELARDLSHLQSGVARRRTFQSRIAYVLDASADWCEQHPTYLLAYLRHRLLTGAASMGCRGAADHANSGDIAAAWSGLIAQGQQAGELRNELPLDQLVTWFHHLYFAALLRWLTTPGLSLRKEFRAITRLFIEGSGVPPSR
jgi:AcrR family transcriptional regulator